jgi:DNA-binding MarR family transcriptional regulator/N-acetylglutamate synthase-like GNAT family acetyltransferase
MKATGELAGKIAAVRRFNRFYTQKIGVLHEDWLDSPFTLAEARVLYELTRRERVTATDLASNLGLDAGYLSRILRGFQKRGLISRKTSPDDARQSFLSLTVRGRKAFAPLEKHSTEEVAAMLARLSKQEQSRLLEALGDAETLLGTTPEPDSASAYRLRAPRPGDFGWIVARHAELYAKEYGWREPFEGLCAQIVADFVNKFDLKKERCWIAERNGENVGTVMLVKDKPGVARLRLLLVEPKARGLGIGARLTGECIRFARKAGYRSITLWTHSVLTGARHIYEKAGFTLTSREPRRSWGQDVVAEYWDLKL